MKTILIKKIIQLKKMKIIIIKNKIIIMIFKKIKIKK